MSLNHSYWLAYARLTHFYRFLLAIFTVSLSLIDASLYQPLYLNALLIAGLISGYYHGYRDNLMNIVITALALIYYLLFRQSGTYLLLNIIAIAITMSVYFVGNFIGAFLYKILHPNPALEQDFGHAAKSNTLVLKDIDSMLSVIVFFIGMILYVTSLILPVWECVEPKTRIVGLDVLISGFGGIYAIEPFNYPELRWLCNFGIILSYIYVFEKKQPAYSVLAFICAIVATTTLFGPYLCDFSTSKILAIGTGLASGGQMWLMSLWILALATAAPTSTKRTEIVKNTL